MTYKFKSRSEVFGCHPKSVWLNRRNLVFGVGGAVFAGALASKSAAAPIPDVQPSRFSTDEEPNSFEDITTYNNFYEFGTGKDDPAKNASALTTSPWTVRIDGDVAKPGDYSFEDVIKGATMEERIYRLRCVEAWSMVIPWVASLSRIS